MDIPERGVISTWLSLNTEQSECGPAGKDDVCILFGAEIGAQVVRDYSVF